MTIPRASIRTAMIAAVGLLLFATAAATAAAPAPALTVTPSDAAVNVGAWVTLTLNYTLPEGAALTDPLTVSGLEEFTVNIAKARAGVITVRLLVDRLETFTIGPLGLDYRDAGGMTHPLQAGPVTLTVNTNLGAEPAKAALKPIRDIIPAQPRWLTYTAWTLAAAGLIGLILAGFWWRKQRRTAQQQALPVDPPHVWAENELAQLVARRLFENGDVKTFYFLFSEIVRRYMEAVRLFPAAEMTTEEIGRQVRGNLEDEALVALLRQADLVKFADAVPTADRQAQDLAAARTYIRQTAPAAPEPTKAPS